MLTNTQKALFYSLLHNDCITVGIFTVFKRLYNAEPVYKKRSIKPDD